MDQLDLGELMSVPGYRDFTDTLQESMETLEREMRSGTWRKGGVVIVDDASKYKRVAFIGDLHGDRDSLEYILSAILERDPELSETLVITLGDYIDRGRPEGQISVLSAVLKLKTLRPNNVIPLRGNHEPPESLEPIPHDYPLALINLYGEQRAGDAYEASRKVFDLMPYAVVLKGYALVVHGGPPTRGFEKGLIGYLGADAWPPPLHVLEEVLWNDPSESIDVRGPSPRGAGYLWGPRVTEKALEVLNVRYIIRGHEPAPLGFKVNHGGRVITLFSRLGPPYYNSRAAFALCELEDRTLSNASDPSSCLVFME